MKRYGPRRLVFELLTAEFPAGIVIPALFRSEIPDMPATNTASDETEAIARNTF